MRITPYLFFDGNCAEAMRFYAGLLQAEVEMMLTYAEGPPGAEMPAGSGDRIMHSRIAAGELALMASDCPPGRSRPMQGLYVSLDLPTVAEAERVFAALSDGGEVQMPLAPTFWALSFGTVVDRFGTPWMLDVSQPGPG